MGKHLLIVDEALEPEAPRNPHWEELCEILEVVLGHLVQNNQEERNLLGLVEARLIDVALAQALDNKSRAARQLGLPRKTLERRARKYRLSGMEKRGENIRTDK